MPKRSHEHDHVDGMKGSLLEPRCVSARCDVQTYKKKRNSARLRSDPVEVSENGHAVIGCSHRAVSPRNSWTIVEHVVIGVRRQGALSGRIQWPILNFPLLVPISSGSEVEQGGLGPKSNLESDAVCI